MVVFPAPFGPSKPNNSPLWMDRLTPSSAIISFFSRRDDPGGRLIGTAKILGRYDDQRVNSYAAEGNGLQQAAERYASAVCASEAGGGICFQL